MLVITFKRNQENLTNLPLFFLKQGIELPYTFNYTEGLNSTELLTADLVAGLFTSLAQNSTPPFAPNTSAPSWPTYSVNSTQVLLIQDGGEAKVVNETGLKHFNATTNGEIETLLGIGAAPPSSGIGRIGRREEELVDWEEIGEKVRGLLGRKKVAPRKRVWEM